MFLTVPASCNCLFLSLTIPSFIRMLSNQVEAVPEQQKTKSDTTEPQQQTPHETESHELDGTADLHELNDTAELDGPQEDVYQPPILIPQAQLDAEWRKTQDDFDKYVAEYTFPDGMTKSGRKKLTKRLHFEFFKKIRRKIEREKWKRKRKKANTEGIVLPPKRRKAANTLAESTNKLRIAVDCSFDDLMAETDIVKLSKQIQRCYALNRHMDQPIQFHLTNIQGKTLSRMDDHVDGYKNWDVHIKSEPLSELFPCSSDVVYLCAESENTLTEFDDSKMYAIGGFVDHNAHKGVAYERAVAAGFSHARLPIDSFFTLATRKVLTVCHVFEIIKNFTESGNWEQAIKLTVPARKGLETKSEGECMTEGESKSESESKTG